MLAASVGRLGFAAKFPVPRDKFPVRRREFPVRAAVDRR
jgi:hypothetical protein